jgi:hypothetical protein
VWGLFTEAPDEVVEKAREEKKKDWKDVEKKAEMWARQAMYMGNYVKARRLFAAVGMEEKSQEALQMWDETSRRAFEHEFGFPTKNPESGIGYRSIEEYGETYGRFYFGKKWTEGRKERQES